MNSWDEIKTAFQVARLGTVSGAADVLGVHHATVIRHVDALEKELGVKLFQRHARGYTATEAGEDLLRVAQATDDQIGQLVSRIKGRGADVSGDLVVTSLSAVADQLTPILVAFQKQHPSLTVNLVTGDRLLRLEYGEAHVALRAGRAPDQPDNVVQSLCSQSIAAYASAEYVAQYGTLETNPDYAKHRFVGPSNSENRAPFYQWLRENVPAPSVTFRCTTQLAANMATLAGAGIGFMTESRARTYPDLIQVHAPRPEWSINLWLVTHVDLHRTTKVQALLSFLKERASQGLL